MEASKAPLAVVRPTAALEDLLAGRQPDPLAPPRTDRGLRWLLALADVGAWSVALLLTLTLFGDGSVAGRGGVALAVLPPAILLFKLYGLYDRDVRRINHTTVDDIPWLFHAVLTGSLLLWAGSLLAPVQRLRLPEIVVFAGTLMASAITGRVAARTLWLSRSCAEKALLVGGGEMASILAGKLQAHPEYGIEVAGAIVPSRAQVGKATVPVLGTLDELGEVVERVRAARVIVVAPGDLAEETLAELLARCRARSLKISVVPALSDLLGTAVEVDDVEGITVLGLNPPWLPRSSRALKRMLDIVLAAGLLLALAPLLIAIAVAIKCESRGPVFFRQPRIGRSGRPFRLLKFRTMVADAEQQREALLERSSDPHWLKLDHDPRITPLGRKLRRLSLDEVPQLWNVLRGEMSMVGPRPLIAAEDARVAGWARQRLGLTPGLTGYWQVSGRTRISFEEMVRLDYLYVMNWSLWGDVRLMLKTLPIVLSGRGAN
jgi:exopolysaccharide biosynthesis polyprenyl glycosylphosphotransferase